MGKNKDIQELASLMAISLRHKIGSLVNKDEVYAQKYAKDAENIMKEAEKVLLRQHWNVLDRKRIKERLRARLHEDLQQREFLDDKKFDMMYGEIDLALQAFELD